ncbi:uncharacterized protein LOC125038596 [Penaeus chinensis]|uniref:uncharacterized protein LOC125038596 n=1 Tax=Penaeus chinensis TaxID=139456 RepID=UPI001FB80DA7|nr:uncharacterized protein LOC125038596 [Penaeus chinensis]
MVGVTRRNRIRNDYIRGTVELLEISEKIQEARLRCFGHLRRRAGEDHIGREVMEMRVQGNKEEEEDLKHDGKIIKGYVLQYCVQLTATQLDWFKACYWHNPGPSA